MTDSVAKLKGLLRSRWGMMTSIPTSREIQYTMKGCSIDGGDVPRSSVDPPNQGVLLWPSPFRRICGVRHDRQSGHRHYSQVRVFKYD